MFEFVLGIGILLVLGILFLMFRVGTLVSIARKKKDEVGTSNKVNALLLVLFGIVGIVSFLWYSWSEFDRYSLPLASVHGADTDQLFWITMYITGAVFVITHILLIYFSYRYQYNEKNTAKFFTDNHKLEIIWTVLPAIVLTLLISKGLMVWGDIMEPAPDDAEVVEIMGSQFAWDVRYPGKDNSLGEYDYKLIDATNLFGMNLEGSESWDDFSPLEIHIPVNKTVLLNIRARDVLHSVYMPHFRLKMDAVPGMPTHFKFTPTMTTQEMRDKLGNPDFNYELACTEICGRGHFSMRKLIVVDSQEDYEKWKASQKTWLQLNPDQLVKIPEGMREAAIVKSGIDREEVKNLEASL
ncbi:MAG: cytochrome c oxidase subunit II [Cyclobacteriaceae bacterium]|nr:cytochrome c oxidase subunit II [Cyclobacteriaceae bacterium]